MSTFTDIITNMKALAQNVASITQAINAGGLASTPTATTATAGTATLPAQPVGFLVITRKDGTQIKIPYYAN